MQKQLVKKEITLPDGIFEYLDSLKTERAGIVAEDGSFQAAQEEERKSNVSFFPDDSWLGKFLYKEVMQVNDDIWKYNLYGFDNHLIQYTSYEPGDHYSWHIDTLDREIDRKLSFSLVLNDDYEHGEFQFARYKFTPSAMFVDAITVPSQVGSLIVFPSYTPHRVLAVKSGIRKSIVGWMVGPPFQ